MISRRKLNHIGAGLLDTFMSRYHDYEGYWAFGVLVCEARGAANRIELDLLAATAHPRTPAAQQSARNHAAYLRHAAARLGVVLDQLEAARIVLAFGLPPVAPDPNRRQVGEPFSCLLHIATRDGRSVSRAKLAHCLPFDAFRGRRSTRYHG